MKKVLIQQYYENPNPRRASELLYVLNRNISSGLFDQIYLLLEGDCPSVSVLSSDRLVRLPCLERLTYKHALEHSTDEECLYVISNNDIIFDNTLNCLDSVLNWDKILVTITRKDLCESGEIVKSMSGITGAFTDPRGSHDAWVVKGGQNITFDCDFVLGVPACERCFAYQAHIAGWEVVNAFPKVNALHVHWSGLRSYHSVRDSYELSGKWPTFNQYVPLFDLR